MSTLNIQSFVSEGEPELCVLPQRQGATSAHDHTFYELVYVKEGFCLHETDGRTMLIMAGDILLIRPGEQHRYIGNQEIEIYNCLFTPASLGDGLWTGLLREDRNSLFPKQSGSPQPLRAHLDIAMRTAVEQRLLHLMDLRRNDSALAQSCELAQLLLECLAAFDAQYAFQAETPYLNYVTQALQYIDAHYRENLTVRQLAASVGVSPDYFTRQFRQVTGITPNDYIRRYRFARAIDLLRQNRPVTEVAANVGFQNLCHFSREFKKHMGMTPSEYRGKNRHPFKNEEET